MKTVKGMRDFLQNKAAKKKYLENLCKDSFEKYGFQPMETPIVEELDLLVKKGSAGEEIEKEIYSFKDKAERKLGLRFDLTVPLARIVATNLQLKMPFKRYQIGRVYRYDRPQAKRYREFTQADVDIIGVKSVLADFECVALAVEIMKKLETEFFISLNSRKLLEELAKLSGVKENQIVDCFRILDKLDKIGLDRVKKELKQKHINSEILKLVKETNLDKIETKLKQKNLSLEGLNELKELMDLLKENSLDDFVKIDLSLARGLAYYTGIVFEVKLKKGPSVAAGGRYDNLIESFGGKPTAAVGISFGIDRLLDSVEEKIDLKNSVQFFVISVGNTQKESLKIAQMLREKGAKVEIDLLQRGLSKNLDYADKKGIPFALILGEKELKQKKVLMKNLESGEENLVNLNDVFLGMR